jgi:hypothetical protein
VITSNVWREETIALAKLQNNSKSYISAIVDVLAWLAIATVLHHRTDDDKGGVI